MLKDEWYFINNRINIENIGEHDGDNRFMLEDTPNQLKAWKENHEGCTPIGICYDKNIEKYGCFPMVFEDENGNRAYVHVDIKSVEDYIKLEEKK